MAGGWVERALFVGNPHTHVTQRAITVTKQRLKLPPIWLGVGAPKCECDTSLAHKVSFKTGRPRRELGTADLETERDGLLPKGDSETVGRARRRPIAECDCILVPGEELLVFFVSHCFHFLVSMADTMSQLF